jgi:peptide/nickel transport system permease protein
MFAYLVRKFFLTLSIVFGVVTLTFLLFNVVARHPERAFAGKDPSPELLQSIKHQMGLDLPKTEQFWRTLTFRFPQSMRYQESVWSLYARKAPVSLAIQLPVFVIELGLQLAIAIYIASRRGGVIDLSATLIAVLMLSVPVLSVYLGAQFLFGVAVHAFPVAGWGTGFLQCAHFAALPILISVIGGLGGPVRFYRTVALEEINQDYVRTARAKGVSAADTMLVHVLRNLMIPVVTNTVVTLPFLVTGALLLEHMFQIPGFGGLMVDAIAAQDSPIVMSQVYLIAIAYAVMLFLTDVCYVLVDPRITLR